MAKEPPYIRNLPVTILSPTPGDALKDLGFSCLVFIGGLITLIYLSGWWGTILGGFFLLLSVWLAWSSFSDPKRIEIDAKRVRIAKGLGGRMFKKWDWEEPLSAFRGVQLVRDEDPERTTIFSVQLVHPDSQKKLDLYRSDYKLTTLDVFVTQAEKTVNAENEAVALAFMNKVSRVLNVTVLEDKE